MAKFLSETGLQTVWSKIDSLFLRKTSVDSVPTANSTNPISSGGMYSVLEEIEDTVAASENALNTRVTTLEENAVTGSGLTADKLVLGNGGKTVKTSTYGVTTTIPSSSSDNTTVPTSKAVWDAFGSVASALKYKGTVASNSELPATHSVGDVYVVSTAGTFAGKACEVGDYIVCKTAGTSTNDGHWDVLNGENQVSNAGASLAAAGSSATIATVDGTNITVTTPSTWTGLTKTGTITKVGNTESGAVTVSSAGATIGTSLTTIGTVGGVNIQAKIGSYAASDHNHNSTYVRLDPGAAEQTIKSSISSMSKGVVNLWRSSGDHYTFLGFSNGTTETALGGIGFKSQADHNLYRKDGSNYYKILDENNYTSYVSTTNFPGLNKTGTVTSVTLSSGTGITVSDSGTAITTTGSRTISLATVSGLSAGTYKSVTVDTYGRVTAGTNPTTLAGYGITDAASSGHNHDTAYVKLNPGAAEQTIQSSIGIADKGVINLYRSNGNYVSYLGFSNKQNNTQTMLGQIGFTAAGVLSYKTANNTTYSILHGGNYNTSSFADTTPTENSTKLITSGGIYSALDEIESVVAASEDALNTRVTALENNTVTGSGLTANTIVLGNGTRTVKTSSKTISTSAPSSSSDDTTIPTSKAVNSAIASHAGVDKVGTVTSVTLTSGTGITVSSSGTAITTSGSRTISLASGVVTAGTYSSVTVDTYGRVTAGSNPTVSTTDTDIRLADFFGESTDSASTTAKTTSTTSKSLTSGDLVTGLCAIIWHQYANSAASATLNVGGSGAKAMYNAAGTRISGSTGTWTAKDIIRWVYDVSLNSGSGGWKISAILGNGDSHRLRLLTGRTPLYSYTETDPTVPSWAKASTKPTYTASEVGAAADSHTHTTTIATSTGTSALSLGYGSKYSLTAGGTSYIFTTPSLGTTSTTAAAGNHTHTFASLTSKPTTVSGYGITDAITGIKIQTYNSANGSVTRTLKDTSYNDITYSPSSGVSTINAIPMYRQDAMWGDWVFYWEGMNDQTHQPNNTKGGLIWKNGEWVLQGNLHIANTIGFYQAGSMVTGQVGGGAIGASFYAGSAGSNGTTFVISVKSSAGGWEPTHVQYNFDGQGILKVFPSNSPDTTHAGNNYWILDESMALTNSEIDTILANAT